MKYLSLLTSLVLSAIIFISPAAAEQIPAEALFQNADNSRFQLSPEATYVSLVAIEGNMPALKIINPETNEVVYKVELDKNQDIPNYFWLNENTIFLKLRVGRRLTKFIISFNDGSVSYDSITVKGDLVARLADQPEHVFFERQIKPDEPYVDLYLIRIDDLKQNDFSRAEKVKHDGQDILSFSYDATFDRLFTVQENDVTSELEFKYIDRNGGTWQTLLTISTKDDEESDGASRVDTVPVGFATPTQLAVLTNFDSDKMALRIYDSAKDEMGEVIYQHPLYDLVDAGFTEDGELDYVSYYEHGLLEYYYFNETDQQVFEELKEAFSNRAVYTVSQSRDKKHSILRIAGSDEPGRYYFYSATTREAQLLNYAYEDLLDYKFSASERISVESKDGVRLEAFLSLPQSSSNSVLLVMPHGGPIGVSESDHFNPEVQYFTSRGFAVLRVNFRGSWGFGKAFMDQGVGQFGRLIEEDLSTVVTEVRKTRKFDKLCSIGASYGGYSATMLAIKHPELYSCVVAGFGIYDLPLLFNTSNYRMGGDYEKSIERAVGEYSDELLDVSPVYFADKLKAPILLVAGKRDMTADFEHTNRFHYVLKQADHKVEKLYYESGGHGHGNWWGDRHEAAAKVDFIQRTLGLSYPDPEQLNEQQKATLAEDLVRLADGFRNDDVDQSDNKVAVDYYELAASYGHARAAYLAANQHNYDNTTTKNTELALHYYKMSAELGYAPAQLWLGRMYMFGEEVEQDWQLAKDYFEKAAAADLSEAVVDELEKSVASESPQVTTAGLNKVTDARIYLAQHQCIAPAPWKDTASCLKTMNRYLKRSVPEKYRSRFNTALASILIEAQLSQEQHRQLSKSVQRYFRLTKPVVALEEMEEGAFKEVHSEYLLVSDISEQDDGKKEVSATGDHGYFGSRFKVDVEAANRYSDRGAITVRWRQTDLTTQEKIFTHHLILVGSPIDQFWTIRADFGPNTRWHLEIYDLNNKLLHEQRFDIVD